jgi:hypothetical protein
MNEKGAIRDLNFLEEIRADFVSCHRFKMTPLLVCGVRRYCLSFTQKQRQVGFVIRFVDANPHRRPRFAVQNIVRRNVNDGKHILPDKRKS